VPNTRCGLPSALFPRWPFGAVGHPHQESRKSEKGPQGSPPLSCDKAMRIETSPDPFGCGQDQGDLFVKQEAGRFERHLFRIGKCAERMGAAGRTFILKLWEV